MFNNGNLIIILKHIFYFVLFAVLNWFCHTVLISVIAFFHFILGYRLAVIDDWVFKNAWSIAFLTKTFSAIVIFKLLSVKSNRRSPFKELVGKGLLTPSREIYLMMILLFTFFFLFGVESLSFSENFKFNRSLRSFFGVFFFYGVEIFVIFSINTFNVLPQKECLYLIPVYSLLFLLHNKVTYFYALGPDFFVFLNFFSLVALIFWQRLNWSLPISLLLIFVAPLAFFLGLDPIWSDEYSVFTFSKGMKASILVGIYLTPMIYLFIKNKYDKYDQYDQAI